MSPLIKSAESADWPRFIILRTRRYMIDQDKFTNRGSIILKACENFSKYLKISSEVRPEQRQKLPRRRLKGMNVKQC